LWGTAESYHTAATDGRRAVVSIVRGAAPLRHVWQSGAASPAGRSQRCSRGLPFQRAVSLSAAPAVGKGDDGAAWVTMTPPNRVP